MGKFLRQVMLLATMAASPVTANDQIVVFGDFQDSSVEGRQRDAEFIEHINQLAPAFSVYIGDIKEGSTPCTDEVFEAMRTVFDQHQAPLIYTPGDNEWTDCWRKPAGGYDARERKSAVVSLFTVPGESLGYQRLVLEQQSEQRENARWRWKNVVFATLHMTGSNNNLQQRGDAINEHVRRDALNATWLEETANSAHDAAALFLFFHANPKWDALWWEPTGFYRFRDQLAEIADRFPRPIAVARGDTHTFRIDKPFSDAPNVTRIEVFGSPQRGAVVVTVDPDSAEVFRFSSILFDP